MSLTQLQDELGTRLSLRQPRGVRLSGEGQRFLGHARDILERVERAVVDLRSLSGAR